MTSCYLAWRAVDPPGQLTAVIDGQAYTQFFEALSAHTHVMIVHPGAFRGAPEAYVETARAGLGMPASLDLLLLPAEQRLIARAEETTAHFLRLADATLRPLEPEPGPINLAPGDAYVALMPGQPPLASQAGLATARFIHLRDYFNADKLAVDLLNYLLADDYLEYQSQTSLGALVIECR